MRDEKGEDLCAHGNEITAILGVLSHSPLTVSHSMDLDISTSLSQQSLCSIYRLPLTLKTFLKSFAFAK